MGQKVAGVHYGRKMPLNATPSAMPRQYHPVLARILTQETIYYIVKFKQHSMIQNNSKPTKDDRGIPPVTL